MVELNITIVVELVLFLLFLWGTNKFIIGPMLNVMDERDAHVAQSEQMAEQDSQEAEALEAQYTAQIAAARRTSNTGIEKTRREGLEKRATLIRERKAKADAEVNEVHVRMKEALQAERARYDEVVPDLMREIAEHLGVGGARL